MQDSDTPIVNASMTPVTGSGFPAGLQRLDFKSPSDKASDWAMVLPPAVPENKDWIISIHGYGANGKQLFVRSDVKRNWLPHFMTTGCGILSPNLRGSLWMNDTACNDLNSLIAWLKSEYGASRIFFYCGSMGGTAALLYAANFPNKVNGMAIMGSTCDMADYYWFCKENPRRIAVLDEISATLEQLYGGTPNDWPEKYTMASAINYTDILKTIPIFLCHGEIDDLMPVSQARQLAAALKDCPNFKYLELQSQGHEGPMIQPLNLMNWLFEHAK